MLAAAVGFALYTADAVSFGRAGDGYALTASFASLEGVREGSEVRLAGVAVGRVAEITLDPESYRAAAVLDIEDGLRIPDDSTFAVASEGLLGGNHISIEPGSSAFHLEPGDAVAETRGADGLLTRLLSTIGGDFE